MPIHLEDSRELLNEAGEVVGQRARRFWDGFQDFALQDNVMQVALGLMYVSFYCSFAVPPYIFMNSQIRPLHVTLKILIESLMLTPVTIESQPPLQLLLLPSSLTSFCLLSRWFPVSTETWTRSLQSWDRERTFTTVLLDMDTIPWVRRWKMALWCWLMGMIELQVHSRRLHQCGSLTNDS